MLQPSNEKTRRAISASELKYFHQERHPESHFFDRETMKFFGDKMSNYGVRRVSFEGRELFELFRRKPVKHGLMSCAYFDAETFEQVHGVKE